MSSRWTTADPGAGNLYAVRVLHDKLSEVASDLDDRLAAVDRARRDLGGSWGGLAAQAALRAVGSISDRVESYASGARAVASALIIYRTAVAAIKAVADVGKSERTALLRELTALDPSDPGTPERQTTITVRLHEITNSMIELAMRRSAADDEVLQRVRAAVATTWDLPPEDYPSERDWLSDATYDYVIDDPLGYSTDEYTAEELMAIFVAHPDEIFPFPVSGTHSTFVDGSVFTLRDTVVQIPGAEFEWETGVVAVTTTATSVKFTVISDDYFDGPGSTIEFSIVAVDGQYVLRKVAHAVDALAPFQVTAEPGAEWTWNVQADKFKQAVEEYG